MLTRGRVEEVSLSYFVAMRETFHAACYINMLVLLVVTVIVCCVGSGAFTPQPQHVKIASTNTDIKVD